MISHTIAATQERRSMTLKREISLLRELLTHLFLEEKCILNQEYARQLAIKEEIMIFTHTLEDIRHLQAHEKSSLTQEEIETSSLIEMASLNEQLLTLTEKITRQTQHNRYLLTLTPLMQVPSLTRRKITVATLK
ncbi:MAG: hypothetical protein QRY71_01825 [Candidatus Rhabdochlamydia sp.]